MNPIYLNILLFWFTVFTAMFCFTNISYFKENFTTSYKEIATLIIIALIAKYPFFQNYFFGLEYEDSYVYDAVARSFLYFQDFSVDPYLTKGCTIGSLNDCQIISTYSGHLITFPSIIYFVFLIFGYSPYTILYINLFFSVTSVILIFQLSKILLNNKTFPFIVSLIYSLTPIMNVFHTSGFSETFSSTFVLLFLYLYFMKFSMQSNKIRNANFYIHWVAIMFSFTFAVLIKRENLILIALPLFTILSNLKGHGIYSLIKKILPLLFTILVVVLFYHFYIDINSSNNAEITDASGNPFNLKYIFVLFPLFIKSFLTFNWFFIFSYSCFVGIILIILKHRNQSNLISILFLFLIYLLIYTIHYRSYYFVKSGSASTFETLRYINNFFPFYCIIAGIPLYYLFEILKNKLLRHSHFLKITIYSTITLLGLLLIIQSHLLKKEFYNIEISNRIMPVTTTIKAIKETDILVTDEPLLFQIFANSNFSIVDLNSIGNYYKESDFEKLIKNENVFYLKKTYHDESIQLERHPNVFRIINKFKQQTIIKENDNFQLIKLSINNEL